MNLSWIDFAILAAIVVSVMGFGYRTRKLTLSVADFLAANRSAGRYLLCVSTGMSGLGAISVIALFEMYYEAGFTAAWWAALSLTVSIIVATTGWVVYRYRQTRAMTLAQFFEMRYSRNFRVFAGILAWVSGIVNFGIFPAVGARFFVYFCRLPENFSVLSIPIPTFAVIMFLLLIVSLLLTLEGGQITVMVTDFIQGAFCNIVFIVVAVYVFLVIGWDRVGEALLTAPQNASLVNPFKTGQVKQFDMLFFIIQFLAMFYFVLAWQGNAGYDCSAKSPHEARMAKILNVFSQFGSKIFLVFLPVAMYTLLHHPDFAAQANQAAGWISQIADKQIQTQMRVPVVLSAILPTGLLGAVAGVMFCAFVGNHDTYLHSWGSIFVQDVILPLRNKPLSPQQHLKYLRLSIVGVAVFIFFFSLIFRQTQYIQMFFALTGSLYLGGAGSAIIGGLYWRRGTTAAAWSALITGAVLAVVGFTLNQIWPDFVLTGQEMMGCIIFTCICVYVMVSLLGKNVKFNLDQMLHRGKYAIETNGTPKAEKAARGLKALAAGKDFTLADKITYILSLAYVLVFAGLFAIGLAVNYIWGITDAMWLTYWHIYTIVFLVLSILTAVWIISGGILNLREMFHHLRTVKRDHSDDGTVRRAENAVGETETSTESSHS